MKVRLLAPLMVLLVASLVAGPVSAAVPTSNVAIYNNVKATKAIKTVEYFKAFHGVNPVARQSYTRAIGSVTFKNNGNNAKFVECTVVYKQVRTYSNNIVGTALVSAQVPAGTTRKRDWSILGGNEGGNVVVNLDGCYSVSV